MSADVCQKCHCQMVYDGVCEYCGDGYDANRTRELQAENARLKEALRALLNKVNAVTVYHRHGREVLDGRLDDLSNRQIEVEEMLASLVEPATEKLGEGK